MQKAGARKHKMRKNPTAPVSLFSTPILIFRLLYKDKDPGIASPGIWEPIHCSFQVQESQRQPRSRIDCQELVQSDNCNFFVFLFFGIRPRRHDCMIA